MFVSAKKDNKNNYRFYLSDRKRVNGKVKCSDKFIITLHKDILIETNHETLLNKIENTCIDKGISLENLSMIMDKIKSVVANIINTTENNNISKELSVNIDNIEIVEAEIINDYSPDYSTTIMLDIQQYHDRNIKSILGFNKLSHAFGATPKEEWQIREEELKNIHGQADYISKEISEILDENIKVKALNNELNELGSTMQLIQDIHINSESFHVGSTVWLIGGGYINTIYFDYGDDIVLPGTGEIIFKEYWNDIKMEFGLSDDKAYRINSDANKYDIDELDLFAETTLDIDINNIEGSLIKLMLSGNYELSRCNADDIDIKIGHNTIGIGVNSFVDFINGKPSKSYKVSIHELLKYKNQLYKFKNVK